MFIIFSTPRAKRQEYNSLFFLLLRANFRLVVINVNHVYRTRYALITPVYFAIKKKKIRFVNFQKKKNTELEILRIRFEKEKNRCELNIFIMGYKYCSEFRLYQLRVIFLVRLSEIHYKCFNLKKKNYIVSKPCLRRNCNTHIKTYIN